MFYKFIPKTAPDLKRTLATFKNKTIIFAVRLKIHNSISKQYETYTS